MTPHSLPVLLLMAVSLYAGVFHLLMSATQVNARVNLYFALICFATTGYDAMCIGLYNAVGPGDGVHWQIGQFFGTCALGMAFFQFVTVLTGWGNRMIQYTYLGSMVGLSLLGLLFPRWVFHPDIPMERTVKAFGHAITYHEAKPGPLMDGLLVILIFGMLYTGGLLFLSLKRGRRDLIPLLAGFAVFFSALFLDILTAAGWILMVYTAEYAFIVLILGMDITMQKRMAGLLQEVEDLNVTLERRVIERTSEIALLMEELSVKNQVLSHLAERDSLTQLLNHATFMQRLDETLAMARRHNIPLTLIMIDLDEFKGINDRFGHPAGDEVLMGIADALASHSRAHDLHKPPATENLLPPLTRAYDLAGRCGGDEFALLLMYCGEPEARAVAQRILHSIAGISLSAYPGLSISASIGGAVVDRPDNTDSEKELVLLADQALYQAKEAGKHCAVILRRNSEPALWHAQHTS